MHIRETNFLQGTSKKLLLPSCEITQMVVIDFI